MSHWCLDRNEFLWNAHKERRNERQKYINVDYAFRFFAQEFDILIIICFSGQKIRKYETNSGYSRAKASVVSGYTITVTIFGAYYIHY